MAKIARVKCPQCGCKITMRLHYKSSSKEEPIPMPSIDMESVDQIFEEADGLFKKVRAMFKNMWDHDD